MSASPMLKALDLTRVDIEAMGLEDLQEHAQQVLNTLSALNEYITSSTRKSANSTQTALIRARLLRMHMPRVRDLIQAHHSAAAMAALAQKDRAERLAPGDHPFGM
jgi:hypothetical protein